MKAIVKKPGESPEVVDTDGSLSSLQGFVEGLITCLWDETLDDNGVTAYANDEGLLIQMTPNLLVNGQPIVGPVVLIGHNDEGETVGLTDEQVKVGLEFFALTRLRPGDALRIAARLAVMF